MMSSQWGKLFTGLAVLALMGTSRPSVGGTITFTGDSALVSALGTTMSTGVTQVAAGQTINIPFSATVAGVESVSGTVVLTDGPVLPGGPNAGSVQLSNVVFTALGSTTSTLNFGLTVTQAFASSGPGTLVATETGSATAHVTSVSGPILPGSADVTPKVTFTPTIYPDNMSSSVGIVPFNFSAFAFPGDTFPEDLTFNSLSQSITGIPKTTGNPVTLTFVYGTSLSPFNATMGAGTSTTLTSGGFGFVAAGGAAVPEPASWTLLTIGALGIAGFSRRRGV